MLPPFVSLQVVQPRADDVTTLFVAGELPLTVYCFLVACDILWAGEHCVAVGFGTGEAFVVVDLMLPGSG